MFFKTDKSRHDGAMGYEVNLTINLGNYLTFAWQIKRESICSTKIQQIPWCIHYL